MSDTESNTPSTLAQTRSVRFAASPSFAAADGAEDFTSQRDDRRQRTQRAQNEAAAATAAALGNNTHEPTVVARRKQPKAKYTDTRPNPPRRRGSRSPSNDQPAASDRVPLDLVEKSRRMRPVEDVLNRIKHDPVVRSSSSSYMRHFVIAYVDRVFGDQEIAFEEFFSSADYKDIPLHRIAYLRYCDEIIWSRASKYDAVFGSSNTTLTLQHWLDRTEELSHQQAERWAHILAEERDQESRDAIMLRALGISIGEQRETIAAMQGELETRSNATSGFDFGRENELDEDEEEAMQNAEDEAEERMKDIEQVEAAEMAVTAVAPAPQPSAEDVLGALASLPQRAARSSRRPAAVATPLTTSSVVTPTAAPATSADLLELTPAAIAATEPTVDLFHQSASCEDDENLEVSVSLFDPTYQRILRTAVVRLSSHFDFEFLRKRIARKLQLDTGVRDVRRIYVQGGTGVKLTPDNFRSLLKNGARLVLMAEVDAKADLAAYLAQPRPNGEEEARHDANMLAVAATSPEPVKGPAKSLAAAAAAALSSSRALAAAVSNGRPNHFISLRITDPSVLGAFARAQQSLVAYNAAYAPFLVPQGTFHITISLICVRSEEDLVTATRVLQEQATRMKEIMHGPSVDATSTASPALSIQGVSSFQDTVVFADLPPCEARTRLGAISALLADAFEAAGVGCSQNKRTATSKKAAKSSKAAKASKGSWNTSFAPAASAESAKDAPVESFTPHITLAKMSRALPPKGKEKKSGGGAANKRTKSKPRIQKQNTGIIELAHDEDDEVKDASSATLPTINAFASLTLSRDNSTASSSSAMDSSLAEEESAPADAFRPASTSVIRRIDRASYAEWRTHAFGSQAIGTLDLCSMVEPKQEDGYYQVKATVQI